MYICLQLLANGKDNNVNLEEWRMNVPLTSKEVITQIQKLQNEGQSLKKKEVKQLYPDLMRSALYYYPSWQHALEESKVG